jgi:hypothetical protein
LLSTDYASEANADRKISKRKKERIEVAAPSVQDQDIKICIFFLERKEFLGADQKKIIIIKKGRTERNIERKK